MCKAYAAAGNAAGPPPKKNPRRNRIRRGNKCLKTVQAFGFSGAGGGVFTTTGSG